MIVCFYPFKEGYNLKEFKNSIYLDPKCFEYSDLKISNWEVYYGNVAVSLSKQKKIVEIPFNENLIKSLVQRRNSKKDFKFALVVPNESLKRDFLSIAEKLDNSAENLNKVNRIKTYFNQDVSELKKYKDEVDEFIEIDFI